MILFQGLFIFIDSVVLRRSYDSVGFRYLTEGRWEKDILRQDLFSARCPPYRSPHFMCCVGFLNLRSSLSSDEVVLRLRHLDLVSSHSPS